MKRKGFFKLFSLIKINFPDAYNRRKKLTIVKKVRALTLLDQNDPLSHKVLDLQAFRRNYLRKPRPIYHMVLPQSKNRLRKTEKCFNQV